MTAAAAKRRPVAGPRPNDSWARLLGLAALAAPTALKLAGQTWTQEEGAAGLIVLATGGWLLWRQLSLSHSAAAAGAPWLTGLLLALSLPVYVAGRAIDFITLEAGGLYGAGLAILYDHYGGRTLAKAWFPLVYLALAIPPPAFLIDDLTSPLKHLAASVSASILSALSLPVSREGVVILVARYQLLVEDACSGMNSLVGLTAIGLLYVYLKRSASPLYALILAVLVIPVAITANVLRIMVLILITYAWGDRAGQSFIHYAAWSFVFGVALLVVFALDLALHAAITRMRKRH